MNCPACHQHLDASTVAKAVAKFGMDVFIDVQSRKYKLPKPLPPIKPYKPYDHNKCWLCGKNKIEPQMPELDDIL